MIPKSFDQPTLAAEDLGEDEMLEVLLQEGDEDVCFSSPIMKRAITETIQDDPELAAAMNNICRCSPMIERKV